MGSCATLDAHRPWLCDNALPPTLRVLITGAGSPATWGTKFSLDADFVEVDAREGFDYQVPYPSERFICALRDIARREKVDVIVPQVEDELLWLARYRHALPCPVLVSPYASIIKAQKRNIVGLGFSGRFAIVSNMKRGDHTELVRAVGEIGFPCTVKLLNKSGGNGVRFVRESLDYSNFEGKPDGWVSFSDLIWMLGDKNYEVLVTEYFPGKEYSVDVLADNGEAKCVVPRTRDVIRSGITFEGETVNDERIVQVSTFLTKELGLDGAVGFQFREDSRGNPMLLECNPRVQGTMVHSTLAGANIIQAAVEYALLEPTVRLRPEWGVKMRRYWGAVRGGMMHTGGYIDPESTGNLSVQEPCAICGKWLVIERGNRTLKDWLMAQRAHRGEIWICREHIGKEIRPFDEERMCSPRS